MGLLRLWLAFIVLRFHATAIGSSWMPDGQAAVQAFFVLSGFAMAMVLEKKYRFERREFWIMRAIKIWPAYFAALCLALAYEIPLWYFRKIGAGVVQEFVNGPAPSWFGWLIIAFSNLTLLGQDLLALVGLNPATGAPVLSAAPTAHWFAATEYLVIPQAWSLSVELVFYACAPWYVRLSTRALTVIFIGGILLRLAFIAAGLPENPWAWRFSFVEVSTFSIGILAWRAYQAQTLDQSAWVAFLKSAAGWALVLIAPLAGNNPLTQSLALGMATALALPWIFSASKNFAWDRVLGEWAYPLYLLHLLISYLGMDLAARLQRPPKFWLLVPASLLLSAVFWLAMRGPLAMLRRKFLKPQLGDGGGS